VAAFALEALGLLLLAVMLWRNQWNLTRQSVTSFLRTGANLPILMFFGLVTLSCAMSPHRAQSEQELLRTGVGVLLYFVVSSQFRRAHHLAKMMDTLLYLAIVSSLIGFTHYATSSELAATGQFGDHQLFGSFLMVLLPILVITAVTETRRERQLAAQVATVLTITCLMLTHARTAWLGSIVAAVVMVALGMSNQQQKTKWMNRKHEWVLPIMLVLAALGFFLSLSPNAKSIANRAGTLNPSTVQAQDGMQYRLNMWAGTLKMIAANPLKGVGAGLYPYFESKYTGLGNALSFTGHNPGPGNSLGEQAHNLYLQTAAELGIPGLLLLVTIITTFFIAGVRKVQTMHRDFRRNLLIGSMATVAAFAVDAFASPSWQFGHIMMFMWLVMGIGASCMQSSGALDDVEPVKAKTVPSLVRRPLTVGTCLAMAAILPTSMLSAQPYYLPPPPVVINNSDNTGAYVAAGVGGAALVGAIIVGATHSHGAGGSQANNRTLHKGDVIDIIVGGHKDMNKTVTILSTGKIKYAVIDPAPSSDSDSGVLAAGMTPSDLASTLQKSLADYGKINTSDQVIVRLNKDYLERQARLHKHNGDQDDTLGQAEPLLHGDAEQQAKTDSTEAKQGQ
jgi:putative inorganic carbon (HCO3(-)) transporter